MSVTTKLYWFSASHPSQAVRRMLDRKAIDYTLVGVVPGMQRIQLRLAGFRHGTVPALKLDGRRVQGTRRIARALEQVRPEPPLFPADAATRARHDEIERWGDEVLQMVPRRIMRWGTVHHPELRRWIGAQSGVPAPGVVARLSVVAAWYYARVVSADEATVRRALEELPQTLDYVDALLADGTLSVESPTAATFQVLCSVRSLEGFDDLRDHVERHPCAAAARELFPDYRGGVPRFLPADWLSGLAPGGRGQPTQR
jgi:glutathione S-transferase